MTKKFLYFSLAALSISNLYANVPAPAPQNKSKEQCTPVKSSQVLDITDMTLTPNIMKKMRSIFGVRSLVEVAPKHRDIASNGVDYFKEIFTIESDHINFLKTEKQFKSKKNVHCYEGTTQTVLSQILPEINERILFWFDGRGSSNITPLLASVESVLKSKQKNGVLLISHILSSNHFEEGGSTVLRQIKECVSSAAPEYDFWIIGDFAVAYPRDEKITPSPMVEACTESSLFEKTSNNHNAVLAAEKVIMTSSHKKGEKWVDLFQLDKQATLSPKQRVWQGLAHLQNKAYGKASMEFNKALAGGEDHWRVYWYIAIAESERHHFKEAKTALKHVIKSAPDFEEAKQLYTKIEAE